jgi:hypothetical protein
MNMHGSLNDNDPRTGIGRRARAVVGGIEELAHDLLDPPLWRVVLTLISLVTTTYGLMLLYNTFTGGSHGSLWFLRFLVPIGIAGILHASIFHLLKQWADTGRRKSLCCALPLQVIAVLASFGTHWLGMAGDRTTLGAYQQALDATERGIITFDASYSTMVTEMAALAAHSQEAARVEEAGGGNSCGDVAGNGRGPRYALRMSDKQTFTEFDSEMRSRKAQVDQFVQRAEALTAGSADQAMARLATLRTIVDEAKARFESDPLLDQIRKTAEARIVAGKGPIEIAPNQRGKSRVKTFTCYDAELERRLEAVIAAIKNLKPLPELDVPDYRDPDTAFPFALWRLWQMFSLPQLLPPSRQTLTAERIRALQGHDDRPKQANWYDLTPLLVALGIECFLVLAFAIGRNPFSRHPGVAKLGSVLERKDPAVFDPIWQALGGSTKPEAVRRAVDANSKFEGRNNWVFVQLYGQDEDTRVLHILMEMLVAAHMARRAYTGRGLMARWYMRGWDPACRARLSRQAVRIYRMTAREYMAFTLDALNRRRPDEQSTEVSQGADQPSPRLQEPASANDYEGAASDDAGRFSKAA